MEDVPIIDNTLESKQRPSGMKKGYVKVSQYNISPWKDFNEENVDMMFRDFLDNNVYNFRSKNLTTIYNSSRYENKNGEIRPFVTYSEADIVKMFEIAIADALNEALSQTAQDFQRWVNLHEPLEIRTSFEGKKIPPSPSSATNERGKGPEFPVYVVVQQPSKQASRRGKTDSSSSEQATKTGNNAGVKAVADGVGIIANGEAKRKFAFDPANLNNGFSKVKASLAQVMMYCHLSDTRYAFLFNSETVTIIRFYKLDMADKEDAGFGMHYTILPWAKTEGKMSAWKGIWALIMLGLNDKHRPVVKLNGIRDLNDWARFKEDDQVVWVNHLSKIVVEDGHWAKKVNFVQAPRDEFAAQLDRYKKDRDTTQRWQERLINACIPFPISHRATKHHGNG
ncbi:hypothetical protein PG990_012276 [Apiospora arundinis]